MPIHRRRPMLLPTLRDLLPMLALCAATASAATDLFAILSDELDPAAPAATLPAAPLAQALADLRTQAPQAVVLVPLREDSRGGVRFAYAAWRVQPDAEHWDAMVVLALPEGARIVEATSVSRDTKAALTALVTHALGSAAPAPPPPPRVDAPLALPERWDVRYVVLLERDPAWVAPTEPGAAEALTQAHIQHTLRLQRDGVALVAGPMVPGVDPGDRVVGMTVLRARDLAEAERIAASDPAVQAGRLKAKVREWRVPAGRTP